MISCTSNGLFLEVPEDSSIPNQVVSPLDMLLPSLLYLMHTLDKDLGTVSDTLWPKISPDVGIIIGTEAEKVKCALQSHKFQHSPVRAY